LTDVRGVRIAVPDHVSLPDQRLGESGGHGPYRPTDKFGDPPRRLRCGKRHGAGHGSWRRPGRTVERGLSGRLDQIGAAAFGDRGEPGRPSATAPGSTPITGVRTT
jgi:hypothetical protein